MDFLNLEYLSKGNPKQRKAYKSLTQLGIFQLLRKYDPILVGTIPIDIDIPESDLDIICHIQDIPSFKNHLNELFQSYCSYRIREKQIRNQTCIIASFDYDGFLIEIFGQHTPTVQQWAYLHMVIEHEIIQKNGPGFKEQIRLLKLQGIKTEPAFAQLLGIQGDPFQGLIDYHKNKKAD